MRPSRCVLLLAFLCVLVGGCAFSETKSVVSAGDIPASKYKKLAVFIENLDDAERPAAEQIVQSTLRDAGINALCGPDVFNGHEKLSEQAKARLVQKEFDAVLYLHVVQKGVREELVSGAYHNGGVIVFQTAIIPGLSASFATDIGADRYILKPDGSVYQPVLALETKADLQDAKTAKEVWTADTTASANATLSNMNLLFTQAANQIVEKMRADQAI